MDEERKVTTTIRVPERIWIMLRALAEGRSLTAGGRPSVSAVIAELAERAARTEAPRVE